MAGFLSGDVKVPGVGEMPKAAVFGGLAVTGLLIYRARAHKSAQGAAGQADPYPSDGTTGNPSDPNSIDPATGVTYGDEAVQQMGAAPPGTLGYGGNAFPWDGTYGNANDPYSMDTSTGLTYGQEGTGAGGGGGGGGGGGQQGPPFSTNQQWASYAEQQLASGGTTDPGQLAEALGLYLAGQPVTTAQESLIFQAEGVAGPVPVAAASGFPPSINVQGSKQGGGGKAQNPVSGLKVTDVRFTQADLAWQAAANATGYRVIVKNGSGSRSSGGGQTQQVSGTSITLHDLHEKSSYTVQVLALPTDSSGYSHEAHTSFRTK